MAFVNVSDMETSSRTESEFWNPAKGDELTGEVLSVKEGSYGKMFLVIETEEDGVFITTQCSSLDKLINTSGVEIGDYVKVVYNGRGDDEYRAHKYELFIWEEDEE